jgi:hypothetical protein
MPNILDPHPVNKGKHGVQRVSTVPSTVLSWKCWTALVSSVSGGALQTKIVMDVDLSLERVP